MLLYLYIFVHKLLYYLNILNVYIYESDIQEKYFCLKFIVTLKIYNHRFCSLVNLSLLI
jgi:hypothetical protein